MKLDILFNRYEDENGYETFTVSPRNLLLNGVRIEEWSRQGSSGNFLVHYRKHDKPVGGSVWRHTGSLTTFDSYDLCKADLLNTLQQSLKQFVSI